MCKFFKNKPKIINKTFTHKEKNGKIYVKGFVAKS
jgi:hypothetical protein